MLKIRGKISPHFRNFLIYNSLSNFICGIETTMSTHSMFVASGSENADAYSILVNMSIKDIVGQFASVPVISSISKMSDKNPVKYLALNLGIFEVSNLLEHLTPLVSDYFIPIAGLANVGKTAGLTGLCSFNVSMISKLSLDGKNVAEINSKVASVSNVAFSIGTLVGLGVVKLLPDFHIRLCLLFPISLLRFYFSLKAIKGLTI